MVVPSSLEMFGLNANFSQRILAQQVEGNMALLRHIAGSMVFTKENTVGQLQKFAQPRSLDVAVVLDIYPAIGSADDGTNG